MAVRAEVRDLRTLPVLQDEYEEQQQDDREQDGRDPDAADT